MLAASTALTLQRSFQAMNTDITITVADLTAAALLQAVQRGFEAFEARFSRFRAESELGRLNRSGGRNFVASDELLAILRTAREMSLLTDGVFEPAILPDLESAGYDRSFELVEARDDTPAFEGPRRAGIRDVVFDLRKRTVRLQDGQRLDLGGIGKGYAVDLAAKGLRSTGNFLIDAGGDIFAGGDGPSGSGWWVSVADPVDESRDLDLVNLRGQAIATSTTARRRWQRAGRSFHHLIDPRTGLPAETDVLSVSVIASTAVEADVFAKVALIRGSARGRAFIEERGAQAMFVFVDGSVAVTPGWTRHRRTT